MFSYKYGYSYTVVSLCGHIKELSLFVSFSICNNDFYITSV